jgi:STE24 endopeptidase
MHWITAIFLLALCAGCGVRLWLASRQIAAARAHRAHVPEAFADQVLLSEHQKAADYTVARARFARVETVVDAVVLLVLTLGGLIAALDVLWDRTGWRQPWQGAAVVASVLLVTAVAGLPFSLWRTFRLEASFGFNRSTLGLYFLDRLKGLVLAVVLGAPLLLAALTLMERGGRWWWLYVWLLWLAVSLALTWAWPAFIAPLFNRFTPLADPALKARIEALVARCGFASQGVFVVDGSRRSAHGNAYFTGVGRNKRIVFFDTLLERLGAPEVEAVLAHELGHFRLKHIRQRLIFSGVITLAGLALLGWLSRQPQFYAALGVARASAHTALLLFLLVAPVFTFFATPVSAWWSRRHEFEADDFAAEHADARDLAAALVKLYRDNATTLTPDRVTSAFYDSHPPATARIAHLQSLAAARS